MIAKSKPSKVILEELYLNQRLSSQAIAKLLHFNSGVTICNYLRKYGIPLRSTLGNRVLLNISKKTLLHLYHKEKLTQEQIAKNFGQISATGVQRLMKKYKISSRSYSEYLTKYPKYNFSGNLEEKAYLIGFRLGDLHVHKAKLLIQVSCSTTIPQQINLIQNLFEQYGHFRIRRNRRGTTDITGLLNQSFKYLLLKKDSIAKWILKDNKLFLSFLAGYADAEGCYYLRKPTPRHRLGWSLFEIQTYDKNIINTIFNKLTDFGIECALSVNNKHIRYKQDMWRVTIVKKQSLWNFIKLLEPYHKHENKIKDLQKVKENILSRNSYRPINL